MHSDEPMCPAGLQRLLTIPIHVISAQQIATQFAVKMSLGMQYRKTIRTLIEIDCFREHDTPDMPNPVLRKARLGRPNSAQQMRECSIVNAAPVASWHRSAATDIDACVSR